VFLFQVQVFWFQVVCHSTKFILDGLHEVLVHGVVLFPVFRQLFIFNANNLTLESLVELLLAVKMTRFFNLSHLCVFVSVYSTTQKFTFSPSVFK